MAILTEKKKINVIDACTDGVYLRWLNDIGGYDYWYFDGNTKEQPKVSDEQIISKPIDDVKGVRSNFEVLKKKYEEGIAIFTSFEKKNAEGFRQLLRSKEVQMYDGVGFNAVFISGFTFQLEKHKPYGKISLTLVFNEVYTI